MDMHTFSVTAFLLWFLVVNVYAIESNSHYTDEWAVEIEGGMDAAREIAGQYGFALVDKVSKYLVLLSIFK